MNYYVYIYLDPRHPGKYEYNDTTFDYMPFYVGKGKGDRHLSHLKESESTTRNNPKIKKIQKIKSQGLTPIIEKVKYFDIESDAYDYETYLIELIGSKYCNDIKDGPLTNICLGAMPPNHKGKTYKEIYGPERANEQREKRRKTQLARGGYGPKKFSIETRKKLSSIQAGAGNGHYGKHHSAEAKQKIGLNNSKTQQWIHKGIFYKILMPNGTIIEYFGAFDYFCDHYDLKAGTLNKNFKSGKQSQSGWNILEKLNR